MLPVGLERYLQTPAPQSPPASIRLVTQTVVGVPVHGVGAWGFHTDPTAQTAAFLMQRYPTPLCPRSNPCARLKSLVATGLHTPLTSTGLHMQD